MNTANAKINFIKSEANLYSWLLNTIKTPYQMLRSYCERQYQPLESLLLG